jgi:hypothetical protein
MLWWQPWGVCPKLTRVAQEAFELDQKKLTTELQGSRVIEPFSSLSAPKSFGIVWLLAEVPKVQAM